MREHSKDEILELIWTREEEGERTEAGLLESSQEENTEELIEELIHDGLVERKGENIVLTPSGHERAERVIRRHRLAECLLSNLFDLEDDHIESSACKFEHILSDRVTESVCTFLGHPPFCPHGKPIPRGECCRKFTTHVVPLVIRLSDAELGGEYRIVFIMPKQKKRLERLSAMGLIPGVVVRLIQKNPSYVIQLGETMIAVDRGIADEIYVKRV